jgi:hypothetical protein
MQWFFSVTMVLGSWFYDNHYLGLLKIWRPRLIYFVGTHDKFGFYFEIFFALYAFYFLSSRFVTVFFCFLKSRSKLGNRDFLAFLMTHVSYTCLVSIFFFFLISASLATKFCYYSVRNSCLTKLFFKRLYKFGDRILRFLFI